MKYFGTLCALILLLPGVYSRAQDVQLEQPVSMLALGDSYTIGQGVDTLSRWPHQLMGELRSMGLEARVPDYIATTGWTTRRLIQGMNYMAGPEASYNLVSILIGVNNQYQGIDISSFEPDLRTIIDKAMALVDQDPSRLLILSIPDYAYTPFGGGHTSISQEIDAYNAIKRRVASEYRIAFVDITPISRGGLSNPSLVAADGLHPSALQYRQWVEAIVPRLRLETNWLSRESGSMLGDQVRVYPNPARDMLRISSLESLERISLFNAAAIRVLDLWVGDTDANLDLSGLMPGIYTMIIHLDNAQGPVIHKLVLFR